MIEVRCKRALPTLLLAGVGALGAWTGMLGSVSAADRETARHWRAGFFTFSDELGGISIIDIRGRGTHDDPVILTQDFQTVSKGTLTVRISPAKFALRGSRSSWTTLYLQLRVINRSPASWVGFRVELQEELGKPSIYGDGLSFNQISKRDDRFVSNRFSRFEVEHEPGDRLTFMDGWVDTREQVSFSLFLLDLTPTPIFYIEQLPHLPAS